MTKQELIERLDKILDLSQIDDLIHELESSPDERLLGEIEGLKKAAETCRRCIILYGNCTSCTETLTHIKSHIFELVEKEEGK